MSSFSWLSYSEAERERTRDLISQFSERDTRDELGIGRIRDAFARYTGADEHYKDIETYDASYYETQLVRAVESVLSPLGWDRTDIRRRLAETREVKLTEFTAVQNGDLLLDVDSSPLSAYCCYSPY